MEAPASYNSFNALEQSVQVISVTSVETTLVDGGPKHYMATVNPSGMAYPYYLYFETTRTIRPETSTGTELLRYDLVKFCQGYMKFMLA
jgi:hypothetical protein